MEKYPAIKFTLYFIFGILIQYYLNIPFHYFLIIFGTTSILLLVTFLIKTRFNKSYLLNVLTVIFIVNLGSILLESGNIKSLKPYSDEQKIKNVTVVGTINEIDLIRDYELRFIVNVDSFKYDNSAFTEEGKILCRIRDTKTKMKRIYEQIYPSNKISLQGDYIQGRNKRNPGEFDYQQYLLSQGIQGIITSYSINDFEFHNESNKIFSTIIFKVRKAIDEQLQLLNNQDAAGLLRGLLLADRSGISHETKTEFINSGVIHVLAVSGLHVGFIIIFFVVLFGRFNIYVKSSITALGLLFFLIVTGSPPSVFRATIMALVIIIALLSNRSTNVFNSLAIAALILLIIDPMQLFNPGFQLSFSAVIGIAAIAPYLQEKIIASKIKNALLRWILIFISVSLAAQIGTLPFTLIYFGKLSIVALFANIIVIPLIGLVVGIGIISLFVSIISITIASYFSSVNDLLTVFLFWFTNITGSFEYSFISIKSFSSIDAVFFYFFAFLMFYSLQKFSLIIPKIILVLLVIINIAVYSSIDDKEIFKDNALTICMIDVGQGDAVLIKFPNNETALIDAGEATSFFDNGERVILPLLDYLGIEKIDYAFISHLHTDHYGGFISLIHNNRIKKIIKPEIDTLNKRDIRLENYLTEMNIPFEYYKNGIDSIGNVRIYVLSDTQDSYLNRSSTNDKSAIIKFVYGNNRFLFTGDAESKVERFLVDKYGEFLKSDLLKAGHHGSKTSSSDNFISYVNPDFVMISAGILNKFNHPSPETIEKFNKINSAIFRTDESGAIIFRSDGESISVIDWRGY